MHVKAQFSDIRQRKKWASADLAILSLPRWSSTEVERNILREKKKTHSELQLVVFFLQEAARMVVRFPNSHECQLVFNTLKTGEFDFKTSQILQSGPHGYGIYAVLHFRSNFSHGFLAFSGVREPDYQGGGNLRKLRHKQTFHRCPAFQVQQQAAGGRSLCQHLLRLAQSPLTPKQPLSLSDHSHHVFYLI